MLARAQGVGKRVSEAAAGTRRRDGNTRQIGGPVVFNRHLVRERVTDSRAGRDDWTRDRSLDTRLLDLIRVPQRYILVADVDLRAVLVSTDDRGTLQSRLKITAGVGHVRVAAQLYFVAENELLAEMEPVHNDTSDGLPTRARDRVKRYRLVSGQAAVGGIVGGVRPCPVDAYPDDVSEPNRVSLRG